MNKDPIYITLAVLLCLAFFGLSGPAQAELVVGAQLGYGSMSYSKVLGFPSSKTGEWSGLLSANFEYEDLLFTGLYQYARGAEESKNSRNLAQVSANYRFLEQDILRVYGGVGYQFLDNRLKHPDLEGGERVGLTGHGFAAQAVVGIQINEQLRTAAVITGNPWLEWSFSTKDDIKLNVARGASFTYQLDLTYSFSQDLGLHLGLAGGNLKIPAFSDYGETKATYGGICLGVTKAF